MKKITSDVVVIGAGHNGLICAAYLAKAGLKVTLLEARHETGGGLDTLEFGGFRHNTHAIYHMMAEIMPAYHDLGLSELGAKFIYPEVVATYVWRDRKPLIFYRDPKKTAKYIAAHFSEQDSQAYTRLWYDFKAYSEKILIPWTYMPPIPAIEMVRKLEQAKDDVGRQFNEVAELTPLQLLELYKFQEPIKSAILSLFTMWGLSPNEALGFIFPLYVYRMLNAALCRGGSHRLSSAMFKAAVESGVQVLDNAEVVKVLLKDGAVAGVLTADGTEVAAHTVASTVDPIQNFETFFDSTELPQDLVEATKRWEWEKTSYFGLHLDLKSAPILNNSNIDDDVNQAMVTFLGLPDTERMLAHVDEVESGKIPSTLMGHISVPSMFDKLMAPADMHAGRFECLVPYDVNWEEKKDSFAERCLEEWKTFAPGIEPLRAYAYPPTYIEGKFKNMVRGSIKHGAYQPLQMGYFRPNESCSRYFTPVEGFYVCGASVYPGGMIIGGPGYNGAGIIADDLEIKKPWNEPEMVKSARIDGLI